MAWLQGNRIPLIIHTLIVSRRVTQRSKQNRLFSPRSPRSPREENFLVPTDKQDVFNERKFLNLVTRISLAQYEVGWYCVCVKSL